MAGSPRVYGKRRMPSKRERKKPGPDPERLKIKDDPSEVIDRLLNVERDDEDSKPRPRNTAQPDVEDEHDDQL